MMPDTTHVPGHSPVHGTDSAVRSADLLSRVKGVFAAKGFDGASMQDLARAAGISYEALCVRLLQSATTDAGGIA